MFSSYNMLACISWMMTTYCSSYSLINRQWYFYRLYEEKWRYSIHKIYYLCRTRKNAARYCKCLSSSSTSCIDYICIDYLVFWVNKAPIEKSTRRICTPLSETLHLSQIHWKTLPSSSVTPLAVQIKQPSLSRPGFTVRKGYQMLGIDYVG